MLNFYQKRQGFTVINYLFIFINNTPFRYQTIIDEIIVFLPVINVFLYSFKLCVIGYNYLGLLRLHSRFKLIIICTIYILGYFMWIDLNKVRCWLFSYKHVLNTFVLLTIPLLNNIKADICFYC